MMTKLIRWMIKLNLLPARALPYEERLRLYAEEKVEILKKHPAAGAEEMRKRMRRLQDKWLV